MAQSKKASGSANKLGDKHVCFNCGAKFYDLKKKKVICPRCEADQADAPAKPSRKTTAKSAKKAKPAPKPRKVEPQEETVIDAQDKGENEVYLDEAFSEDLVDDEDEEI